MNRVTIVGLGWLGEPLALRFQRLGYSVFGTTTSMDKVHRLNQLDIHAQHWIAAKTNDPFDGLCFSESLVLTIPPSRCPDYLETISMLCQVARAQGCQHVLYVSSTSVYGANDAGSSIALPRPDDERGALILAAEQAVLDSGIPDVTILRSAGQYGPGRYPGRFLSGKLAASGGAPVNLVHLDDLVAIVLAIFQNSAWGQILNACSPHHPSRFDFYTRACELIGLPVPRFSDLSSAGKLIDGHCAEQLLGYCYHHSDLYRSLETLISKE